MGSTGGSERTVAECLACGSVYAAEEWADGTVQPIGTREGCRCGSTAFRTVDDSAAAGRKGENTD